MAGFHMIHAENILSVQGFYSMHHFDLTDYKGGGELHDFYELVYVESGFYYVILDGERHTVPPGSVIFFAPNTFHSGDGATPINATVRILSFECTSEVMHSFDNCLFALSEEERQLLGTVMDAAKDCLTYTAHGAMCLRPGAEAADLQRLKLLTELFLLTLYQKESEHLSVSGRAAVRKEEFRRISDYLKQNLKRPLTLPIIANECSVSVAKLKNLCRLFCNCGPIDYLISLRITRAKYLLRESTLNCNEIAEETGFASPHYFSRVFRARVGLTPTEYAKEPYRRPD